MNKQMIGWVLVIAGLVIGLIGALADALGIGGQPGFGYKQILAVVAGIIIAVVGLALARQQQA